MHTSSPFRRFILTILALMIVLGCDDGGDQRSQTERSIGEPDILLAGEYSTYKWEYWVYAQRDIDRVYEFRKTTGTCGGNSEWYLYRRYLASDPYYFDYELYDEPPTITHEPIVSAPAGKALTISATITISDQAVVDTGITGARLMYRVAGDSLTTSVGMNTETDGSSLFTAQIPAEFLTTAGLEYAIEACSNEDTETEYYWSRLPAKSSRMFFVEATESQTVEKAGYIDTTTKPVLSGAPSPSAPFSLSPLSQ